MQSPPSWRMRAPLARLPARGAASGRALHHARAAARALARGFELSA